MAPTKDIGVKVDTLTNTGLSVFKMTANVSRTLGEGAALPITIESLITFQVQKVEFNYFT